MSGFLALSGGGKLALDEHGHLQSGKDWSKVVAEEFAGNDDIKLSEMHWIVITVLRDYYQEYEIEPPMRALVKELKLNGGESVANSLELYRLFPQGPVRQGSRYAGLPLPVSCI
jgi:TusE/DsrC/DsvC family sulfur relay protein